MDNRKKIFVFPENIGFSKKLDNKRINDYNIVKSDKVYHSFVDRYLTKKE